MIFRTCTLSTPLDEWEFKQGGFITFQLLAHYFLGVGSFGRLFCPVKLLKGED